MIAYKLLSLAVCLGVLTGCNHGRPAMPAENVAESGAACPVEKQACIKASGYVSLKVESGSK